MDENEQLQNLLKPVNAMREGWFSYADEIPVVFGVQGSAQRLDYLLGSTIAAYGYVIQKSQGVSRIDLVEWQCRYKETETEIISFYDPFMHFWKLNELIGKLCLEARRTGYKIRPSLQRELMLKQLEMCRMMVNYSIEGDIWNRAFSAALSLIELCDLDEEMKHYVEDDPSVKLTYLAQSSCLSFWDKKDDFTYPRFSTLKDDHEIMLTLLGVGVNVCLRAEGALPLKFVDAPNLLALYDFDSNEVITIRYKTPSGVFYRERGFWWNFGRIEEEFFDDFEMIYVRPEFVEHFDLMESIGKRVSTDDITPYALTYEELFPND